MVQRVPRQKPPCRGFFVIASDGGKTMAAKQTTPGPVRRLITTGFAATALIGLVACNGGDSSSDDSGPIPLTVPKASCGSADKPESGLQGQVSAAARAAGFKGYSCNLQLVGQSKGDGGSWQHAFFADKSGHKCNYYD